MVKGIVIGIFCFIIFLSHIFIFHKYKIKRRFFTMLTVFLAGLLIYFILFIVASEYNFQKFISSLISLSLFAFLNGAFLHFFSCYFYLHLVQIIDRTPTARIMIEIDSSTKKLTVEEIKERYSLEKKIANELEDMIVLGYLKKYSNFYEVTSKGRIHFKIFRFIRNYLKLERN